MLGQVHFQGWVAYGRKSVLFVAEQNAKCPCQRPAFLETVLLLASG